MTAPFPDPYSVTEFPADQRVQPMVVAFGGGQSGLGGIEINEFAKSLGAPGGRRGVLFVRERQPRWYNSADDRLIETLQSASAGRRLVTLGNSMGGFAAILFSLLLPGASRSISFCPQFSVCPEIVSFERRWRDKVAKIESWKFPTCLPDAWNQPKNTAHFLFLGEDTEDDLRHAELIVSAAKNPAIAFRVGGCGHDVARFLKGRNLLVPLLDELIEGDASTGRIEQILLAGGSGIGQIG